MTSVGFPCKFDKNVSLMIATFLIEVPYKFLDWVQVDKLIWSQIATILPSRNMIEHYSYKFEEWKCWHSLLFNKRFPTLFAEDAIEFIKKHIQKKDIGLLCYNENAIPILKKLTNNFNTNLTIMHWNAFCEHASSFPVLKRLTKNFTINMHILNWYYLSFNPNAIDLLERKLETESLSDDFNKPKTFCWTPKEVPNVNWANLCQNRNAMSLIKQYIQKIDWYFLCSNPSAVSFLEEFTDGFTNNLDKIWWRRLSINPQAIHILEKHKDKIDWRYLCWNVNAIHLIEEMLDNDPFGLLQTRNHICESQDGDKICWMMMSKNPNAIHLLSKNIDKVDWHYLSENPSIFEIDNTKYNKSKQTVAQYLYNL